MPRLDLTNQSFGRLTVRGKADKRGKQGQIYWHCDCICGKSVIVRTGSLRNGTKSCGCLHIDAAAKRQLDLTNQNFGRLKVTGKADKRGKQGQIYWHCDCVCGKSVIVGRNNLCNGSAKSCGCLQAEIASNLNRHPDAWHASRTFLINEYKQNAKKKSHTFALSVDECEILFKGNCTYCGIAPYSIENYYLNRNGIYKPSMKKAKRSMLNLDAANYIYNGIDRVDNNLGYVLENCVSCCEICNDAKWYLTIKEWDDYLKRLVNFKKTPSNSFIDKATVNSDCWKSFLQLIKNYKRMATARKLTFELTQLHCETLFLGNCNYCGVKPHNTFNYALTKDGKTRDGSSLTTEKENATFTHNGIDRIDSLLGYILTNCVSCCKLCNNAKQRQTLIEFNLWVERLVNFQLNKYT